MSSDAASATQHRRRSARGLGRRAAQRAERGRRACRPQSSSTTRSLSSPSSLTLSAKAVAWPSAVVSATEGGEPGETAIAESGTTRGPSRAPKNVAHVVRAVPPATTVRCHRQQQQQQSSFLLPSNGYTTRLGSGSAGSAPLRTRSRFPLVVHDDDPSCILRLPKARDSRATRWRRSSQLSSAPGTTQWRRSSRSSHSLNIHHHHHHPGAMLRSSRYNTKSNGSS